MSFEKEDIKTAWRWSSANATGLRRFCINPRIADEAFRRELLEEIDKCHKWNERQCRRDPVRGKETFPGNAETVALNRLADAIRIAPIGG